MMKNIYPGYEVAANLSFASLAELQAYMEALPADCVRVFLIPIASATAVGLPQTRYALIAVRSAGGLCMVLATSFNQNAALYKITKPYNSAWATDWVQL